jgi:hypothetical protein
MQKRLSTLAGTAACAVALIASAGCAGSSGSGIAPASGTTNQASPVVLPSRIAATGFVGHPHYMPTRFAPRPDLRPFAFLSYGGGRLLYTPKMYLIFWHYTAAGDPKHVQALLTAYAKAVGGSALDNVTTQYTGTAGSIKNPKMQFGGAWSDNASIPKHPTDAQIAAEAVRGVAHFGYDPSGAYLVATPHGHSTNGFGTQFCGYHSSTESHGNPVSYTAFSYIPDAGEACGANNIGPSPDQTGDDEGVTIVAGHEYAEAITDPDPFSGWNSVHGEIGDVCAWTDIENDPFKKKSYASQPEFSNANETCVHSYP